MATTSRAGGRTVRAISMEAVLWIRDIRSGAGVVALSKSFRAGG